MWKVLKGCSTPGWAWQHCALRGGQQGGGVQHRNFIFIFAGERESESESECESGHALQKLHKAFFGGQLERRHAAAAAGGCCEKRFSHASAETASSWKMYAQLNASEKRVAETSDETPC